MSTKKRTRKSSSLSKIDRIGQIQAKNRLTLKVSHTKITAVVCVIIVSNYCHANNVFCFFPFHHHLFSFNNLRMI